MKQKLLSQVEIPLLVLVGIFGGMTLGNALNIFAQGNETVPVPIGQLVGETLRSTTAMITAGISLALILIKIFDSWLARQKDSAFKRKATEVSSKLKNSLEESDKDIKEIVSNHAKDFQTFAEMISRYPTVSEAVNSKEAQDFFKKLNTNAKIYQEEFDRWYNYASTVSGLSSKDPNIAKLAEVETQLTPTGKSPNTTGTDTASSDAV